MRPNVYNFILAVSFHLFFHICAVRAGFHPENFDHCFCCFAVVVIFLMLMEIHVSQTMYCRVKHLGRKDTYFHLILFLLFSDILNWNMTGAEITESVIKKALND